MRKLFLTVVFASLFAASALAQAPVNPPKCGEIPMPGCSGIAAEPYDAPWYVDLATFILSL